MATNETKTASQKIRERLSGLASLGSKYGSKYAQAIKDIGAKDKEQSGKIKQFIKEDIIPAMGKSVAPLKDAATDAIKPLGNVIKTLAPMDLIKAAKGEEFSKAGLALDVAGLVPMGKVATTGAKAGIKTIAKQPVVKEAIENVTPVVMKGSEKAKNLIDAAKGTFNKYLSKDARVKTAKDKLSKLEKAFKKDNSKLDPTQQKRVEEYIAKEKERLKSLEQNSWMNHLANERKKVKIDKQLQKIANPDGFIKKTGKWGARIGAVGLGGTIISEIVGDGEDEDTVNIPNAYEGLSDSTISQDQVEIPNPYKDLGEEDTSNEIATDTEKQDNNNIDTTKKEKQDTKVSIDVKTDDTSSQSTISAGTVYAKDGSAVPLLLMNGSYVVRKPDGSYHTLETGVTNANKRHKYTLAANKPLPF